MNYNPAAHVREIQRVYQTIEVCSCGWRGISFDMHLVAMEVADEVLNVIEEEDDEKAP